MLTLVNKLPFPVLALLFAFGIFCAIYTLVKVDLRINPSVIPPMIFLILFSVVGILWKGIETYGSTDTLFFKILTAVFFIFLGLFLIALIPMAILQIKHGNVPVERLETMKNGVYVAIGLAILCALFFIIAHFMPE